MALRCGPKGARRLRQGTDAARRLFVSAASLAQHQSQEACKPPHDSLTLMFPGFCIKTLCFRNRDQREPQEAGFGVPGPAGGERLPTPAPLPLGWAGPPGTPPGPGREAGGRGARHVTARSGPIRYGRLRHRTEQSGAQSSPHRPEPAYGSTTARPPAARPGPAPLQRALRQRGADWLRRPRGACWEQRSGAALLLRRRRRRAGCAARPAAGTRWRGMPGPARPRAAPRWERGVGWRERGAQHSP